MTADRVPPLAGQLYARVDLDGRGHDYDDADGELTADVSHATTITSIVAPGAEDYLPGVVRHKPVLDIDLPCALVPSSPPGHFHLYIDKPMTWGLYARLLAVLVEVGIVEPGYVEASFTRGRTEVRLPWIRKAQVPSP